MFLNYGVGEDSWESLGLQGYPVHPKGNQSWIFIGRTDAEAEAPVLWPPDTKSHLIGKAPDAGNDWGQVEKGTTENEIFGWHHWLNGHEFEQTSGDCEGQRSLVYCSPRGCRVRHNLATEQQLMSTCFLVLVRERKKLPITLLWCYFYFFSIWAY